jgi:ketosteroid isomerase-like protein
LVLFTLIVLQAGSQGIGRNPENDRKAVETVEREWLAHESDRPWLERFLAADFAHPVPQGLVLTKQQQVDWAVSHPRPANRIARFEEVSIRVYGDTAIATGIVNAGGLGSGDSSRTIFTDVFVYRDGRWQAVNAQENVIRPAG